jgi:hypothetical protein
MTRPTPEWTTRAAAMRAGEVIIVDTDRDLAAVRYHLRKLGKFKCKTIAENVSYRIERVK